MISHAPTPARDRPISIPAHRGPSAQLRIVVVEDDPLIALDLETALQDLGHEVCACAANSFEANALVDHYRPDVITLDLNLSDGPTGVSIAHALHSRHGIRALIISGSITPSCIEALRSTDPLGYLDKPHKLELIKTALGSFSRTPFAHS